MNGGRNTVRERENAQRVVGSLPGLLQRERTQDKYSYICGGSVIMAKKIQNKRYLVNRAVYKAVKKYDHQQFENFCTDIYKSGWEDGKASVNALDVKDIEAVIRSVKGIGEVRIGKIMEAINEKFDENAGSEETE